jgi:hypothetical protein
VRCAGSCRPRTLRPQLLPLRSDDPHDRQRSQHCPSLGTPSSPSAKERAYGRLGGCWDPRRTSVFSTHSLFQIRKLISLLFFSSCPPSSLPPLFLPSSSDSSSLQCVLLVFPFPHFGLSTLPSLFFFPPFSSSVPRSLSKMRNDSTLTPYSTGNC